MKQTDLIVLGLAGLAVYMIARSGKAATGATSATGSVTDAVKEVFDSAGKAFENGWRYFTDGTAIDPAGNYYSGGQLIWRNPATLTPARWGV